MQSDVLMSHVSSSVRLNFKMLSIMHVSYLSVFYHLSSKLLINKDNQAHCQEHSRIVVVNTFLYRDLQTEALQCSLGLREITLGILPIPYIGLASVSFNSILSLILITYTILLCHFYLICCIFLTEIESSRSFK